MSARRGCHCSGQGMPVWLAKASRWKHTLHCLRHLLPLLQRLCLHPEYFAVMFLTRSGTATAPGTLWALLQHPRSSTTLWVGTGCSQDHSPTPDRVSDSCQPHLGAPGVVLSPLPARWGTGRAGGSSILKGPCTCCFSTLGFLHLPTWMLLEGRE